MLPKQQVSLYEPFDNGDACAVNYSIKMCILPLQYFEILNFVWNEFKVLVLYFKIKEI